MNSPPPPAPSGRPAADGPRWAEAHLARLAPRLRAWFVRSGVEHAAVDDCLQEVWLRLLRALPTYERRAPLSAFAALLARNTLIDWRRRRRARPATGTSVHDPAVRDEAAPAPTCSDALLDLRSAVDALPPHLKEVVLLSLRQGLAYADIAARLHIPVGTVKSRMHHAVRALRRRLGEEGP